MATTKKTSTTAKNSHHPLEGNPAPEFELERGDGKTVSLGELIGRRGLVLYFYPKDMTPGCTTEACDFRDNLAAIRKLGCDVAGISADPPARHRKFKEINALNFTLLSDPDHRVGRLYGVYKKKSLYGREFMGIERTTFIIDRLGVVRKVYPKVKVKGHADEVLAALKELG